MDTIKDPVCGMTVSPDTKLRHVHQGKTYLFCNPKCMAKFQATPEKYLNPQPAQTAPAPSGVMYVCPMDPEVRQLGPGSCPKCGMALEPETPLIPGAVEYTCPMHPEIVRSEPGNCPICGMALEPRDAPAEDNAELRDMTRRFWVSTALAWLEFALATPAVLWGGWPIFQRGWASLVNRHLNMFTLIALGVGVAWTYSIVAMLLPGIFPPAMRSMMGTVPVYFEAAAVIMAMVLLGQVMELRARSQTSAAIKLLLGLAHSRERLVRAGAKEEDIPLAQVQPNDCLLYT